MRAAASSGSRSSPAASARRNSSARCDDAARALLAADHHEVVLVAVQPGHEHDAGLVEARRRREDVARQRHRRREDRVEARAVAGRERGERRGRRRRDRVEDAEQRVGVPGASPSISSAKLKSSPVYMRTPAGSRRRMAISLSLSSSDTLTPSTLAAFARDDGEADVHRARVMRVARESARADPVAGERRVEHLAEPVQDHRRAHLRQDAVVDVRVVVGRLRARGQRAARHQDDAAAGALDRRALLLVGGDHALDRHARGRGRDGRCPRPRTRSRPERARASATLRRISSSDVGQSRPMPRCAVSIASATPNPSDHRCRRNASVASQSMRGGEPGIASRARVGDDVRGGERDAVEARRAGGRRPRARRAQRVRRERRRRMREAERGHGNALRRPLTRAARSLSPYAGQG